VSFRLWTIFYVFALFAAALATFGTWGVVAGAVVLGFWAWVFYAPKRDSTVAHLLFVFVVILLLIGLLLPSVQSAREASRRSQCLNNIRQLWLACLNYEAKHGALPPAYVADANGKPMHSWRVLILPYLEQQALYDQYNFDEPWNGPNNSKLAGQMPDVFRCPSSEGATGTAATQTNYFVIAGNEAAFPVDRGRQLGEFRDGAAHTLVLVEASGLGVHWMDPRDVALDEVVDLLTTKLHMGHRHVRDRFLTTTYCDTSLRGVVYCDGHVESMGQFENANEARALLTTNGSEPVSENYADAYVDAIGTTVVKWRVVYALSLFVALSLLPAAKLRMHNSPKGGVL
jgi:hypothetical protein